MKTIFVGTGSGKTSLSRFHSSILFDSQNHNLLVDTGDSISRALLNLGVEYNSINSILLSHYHSDHLGGMASLITQMKLTNRETKLNIYTHKNLKNSLINYLNSCYIFLENLGFEVNIFGFEFNELIKVTDTITFKSRQNTHITNKYEELKFNDINFLSSSFNFKIENSNIVYTSDVGSEEDLYLFQDEKADLLIAEITHISEEHITRAANVLNPGKIILTHIEEEDETRIKSCLKEYNSKGDQNIKLAFDGMEIIS